MIFYVLGRIMLIEGILMTPSMIVGLIYSERAALAFVPPCLFLIIIGIVSCFLKPESQSIYARDGFLTVGLSWIIMSLAGAVPFMLCGEFPSVWDCIFEIVSGFTTTGASVLPSVEQLPHCILFWRSFTHWVGGMGVLVFVMAVLPMSSERSLHLMRAEVPGPVVGKLVPRMKETAKILYCVYGALTVVLFVLLICGGMPVFDSLCNAFGTAGTGGFAVKNAGIAAYDSAYIEMVIAVFMLIFGVNFNLYYLILIKKVREVFRSEELRCYLIIVAAATAIITLNIFRTCDGAGMAFRQAFFQVSSIITTTGFATVDFASKWPVLSQTVLLILMFTGACAGSTGGGFKISRVMIMFKSFVCEIRKQLHPKAAIIGRMEGRPISNDLMHSTLVYFAMYAMIICVSVFILSFDCYDFTTVFSAELSCINNIGPGLGAVGPYGNFGGFSALSKMVLTLNMLLGRLEIFPILILFSPNVWRKNIN